MQRLIPKIIMSMIALTTLISCASSKLQLELAVYNEDPFIFEIVTTEDIEGIEEKLQGLYKKIEDIAASRVELAKDMFNTYEQYQFITSRARAAARNKVYTLENLKNDMEKLSEFLEDFKLYIMDAQVSCKNNLDTTIRWLGKYQNYLSDKSNIERSPTEATVQKSRVLNTVRIALDELQSSFNKLSGQTDTHFEKTLLTSWPRIFKRMRSEQVQKWIADVKNKAELDKLKQRGSEFLNRLEKIKNQGVEVNQDLMSELAFVDQVTQPQHLEKIEEALMKPVTQRVSLGDKSFIEQLKKFDLLGSQIERLQNPGDPVWKIVTSKENQDKWNVEFSKTYFRAEGNSSVVVVRDSPIEFRVQQGSNDPSALVQAQLQVSRAITDAAITVAGATTGVNLAALKKAEERTSSPDESLSNESEQLARLKAKIEREEKFRDISITRLKTNLRSIRSQLEPLNPGKNEDKATIERMLNLLVTTLKADEIIFKPFNESK